MIRSARLLCAGIIMAAACSACAPAASPPPAAPPVAAARLAGCDPNSPGDQSNPNDLGSFVPAVHVLRTGFNPKSFTTPPIDNTTMPTAQMQSDLKAAFFRAPMRFRTALCGLDGVYIDAGADHSWGFRNFNDGKRYIALAPELWPTSASTLPLHRYQNKIFGPPLSWDSTIDASPPGYRQASPNDGPMTILAALAHEFGHVLWSDILVTRRDGNGVPDTDQFCNGILTRFLEGTVTIPFWTTNLQGGPWKTFADRDANPADIPDNNEDLPSSGDPDKAEAKAQKMWDKVKAGDPHSIDRAHMILWRILAPGRPFPSLLGAFSANEQFVETVTLHVLMQAGLTSLPLHVSANKRRDIPDDLLNHHRKRLARVLGCFDNLLGQLPL